MPDSSISLETRILGLPNHGFGRLGLLTARKLASGIAAISGGRDTNHVTVEDLLHYLPLRYEDRSKFTRIVDLSDGMEASLELFVTREVKQPHTGGVRFANDYSNSKSLRRIANEREKTS